MYHGKIIYLRQRGAALNRFKQNDIKIETFGG